MCVNGRSNLLIASDTFSFFYKQQFAMPQTMVHLILSILVTQVLIPPTYPFLQIDLFPRP